MLTKETKKVLYRLYKEYLSRRKADISKAQAICFGAADSIQRELFSDWSISNLSSALYELSHNKLVSISKYDNKITRCDLTNSAIALMENQKKDALKSAADFVVKFIP